MSDLSDYERGTLALKAWKALKDWGFSQPDGSIKKWDFGERIKKARYMANRLASDPDYDDNDANETKSDDPPSSGASTLTDHLKLST